MNIKPLKEDDIQAAFVQWLRLQHPCIWFHHSPNEGRRNAQHNVKIKKMGLCKGWPDIEILIGKQICFMEFKIKTGRMTKEQKAFMEHCIENEIPHAVPRSTKEAIEIFQGWFTLLIQ